MVIVVVVVFIVIMAVVVIFVMVVWMHVNLHFFLLFTLLFVEIGKILNYKLKNASLTNEGTEGQRDRRTDGLTLKEMLGRI